MKEVIRGKNYPASKKLKTLKLMNQLVKGDEKFAEQVAYIFKNRFMSLASHNKEIGDGLYGLFVRGSGIFEEKTS